MLDASFIELSLELKSGKLGEAPLVRDDDFLSSREFVLSSSEGFYGLFDVSLSEPNGIKDGTDFDSGDFSVGFSESSSHTGLESISTSA